MSEPGEGRLFGKLAPLRQCHYQDVRTGESCHKHFVNQGNLDRHVRASHVGPHHVYPTAYAGPNIDDTRTLPPIRQLTEPGSWDVTPVKLQSMMPTPDHVSHYAREPQRSPSPLESPATSQNPSSTPQQPPGGGRDRTWSTHSPGQIVMASPPIRRRNAVVSIPLAIGSQLGHALSPKRLYDTATQLVSPRKLQFPRLVPTAHATHHPKPRSTAITSAPRETERPGGSRPMTDASEDSSFDDGFPRQGRARLESSPSLTDASMSDAESIVISDAASEEVAGYPTIPRKRKYAHVSHLQPGRTSRAIHKPAVPTYAVKQSKKVHGQQEGINWLTHAAKLRFEQHYETLLARWGVKPSHKGTCILLPEAWKALEPLDLVHQCNQDNYPRPGSDRLWFAMYDHGTAFARAVAWFQDWPRTGVQLDNFLECGPFQAMDGSHTCHHDHCIIHATYDPAPTNQDRQDCSDEAKRLRSQGLDVPEFCPRHHPPCLMQHAALTTFETYCIQFAVLRQAKGLELPLPLPRKPRSHNPTFETTLPCKFPAIQVKPQDLVKEIPQTRLEGKPELRCRFCARLKGYNSVIGLWAHLVNKHPTVSAEERLAEVKRTARLWRAYWDAYSDGGKNSHLTEAKLRQTECATFSWQDVEDWRLR